MVGKWDHYKPWLAGHVEQREQAQREEAALRREEEQFWNDRQHQANQEQALQLLAQVYNGQIPVGFYRNAHNHLEVRPDGHQVSELFESTRLGYAWLPVHVGYAQHPYQYLPVEELDVGMLNLGAFMCTDQMWYEAWQTRGHISPVQDPMTGQWRWDSLPIGIYDPMRGVFLDCGDGMVPFPAGHCAGVNFQPTPDWFAEELLQSRSASPDLAIAASPEQQQEGRSDPPAPEQTPAGPSTPAGDVQEDIASAIDVDGIIDWTPQPDIVQAALASADFYGAEELHGVLNFSEENPAPAPFWEDPFLSADGVLIEDTVFDQFFDFSAAGDANPFST